MRKVANEKLSSGVRLMQACKVHTVNFRAKLKKGCSITPVSGAYRILILYSLL